MQFLRWERVFRDNFPVFPAFSIRQNTFPSQKSGKSDGNVFWQIAIMPKAMGTWFQQRLLLPYKKIHFLINFRFFSTCMAPKNTNTQHLTITLIIQAVKRETSQYFATGTCFDKFYSHQKRWERVLATGTCFINWNWWKCDGNAFTKTHFSGL